jgi:hypothetical protein
MPDRLHFTDSDEANELIATDPMALLIGFALDQQVTVQKAFSGPLALRQRLGTLDADTLASTDLEPIFREPPTSATTTTATPRACGPTLPTPTSCAPTSARSQASER